MYGVHISDAPMHVADLLAEDLMDDVDLELLINLVGLHCGPLVNEGTRDFVELAVAD